MGETLQFIADEAGARLKLTTWLDLRLHIIEKRRASLKNICKANLRHIETHPQREIERKNCSRLGNPRFNVRYLGAVIIISR